MSITTKAQRHKVIVLLCVFVPLWLLTHVLAQTPGVEGTWFGTINPPGAQFDIAINLQRDVAGWTGMLLMENGANIPLREMVIQPSTISFLLDGGGGKIAFKGTISA